MIGYLADLTGGYTAAIVYVIACGLIGRGVVLSLRTTASDTEEPPQREEPQPAAVAPTLTR